MLGNAYYTGFTRAIRDIQDGKKIEEEFEIIVKDESIFEKIKPHMGHEVELKLLYRKKEGGKTRIRFSKIYKSTTKKLKDFLIANFILELLMT